MKMLTTAAVVLAIFFTAVNFFKEDIKLEMAHATDSVVERHQAQMAMYGVE